MVIGGATAPDYFFFILSRRSFFYLSQKAFFLSLADGADLADLYDRHMVRKVKICVICGICEKTISANINYLSQISQIIIASGEGSQRKDLRHLRNLRDNNFSACNTISRRLCVQNNVINLEESKNIINFA